MFLFFWLFFSIKNELVTRDECMEMIVPWQWCWTTCPLIRQRLQLASAKSQPIWDFQFPCMLSVSKWDLPSLFSDFFQEPWCFCHLSEHSLFFGPGHVEWCASCYLLFTFLMYIYLPMCKIRVSIMLLYKCN